MKPPLLVLSRILLLAALLWIFFLVLHPSKPPSASETLVLVFLALALERAGALLWRSIRRRTRRNEEPDGKPTARLVLAVLLGHLLATSAVWAGGSGGEADAKGPEAAAPVLVCRPSPPAVAAGGRVELRTFAEPEPEKPAWTWTVETGEIVGSGDRVFWELGAAAPGYYTATAVLETADGPRAECAVRVRVRSGMKGGTSLSGRSLLDCGSEEKEAPGYGLYSYLLFGSASRPSAPETEERYLATLRAFVDLASDVEDFQLGLPRREINLTYLVTQGGSEPPPGTGDPPLWLLERYDWSCAQELLAFVPGEAEGPGPFLVSLRRPLAAGGPLTVREEHLYQDLSLVSGDLLELWIREFLIQTRQGEFWEPRTGPRLALHLRTTLGLLARANEAVRPALSDWLQWLGERSD